MPLVTMRQTALRQPALTQPRLLLPGQSRNFLPTDLPGCVLWLDAASIAQADSTPVALWADKSGQGNHASQATAAAQPTYMAGVINGRPALSFDGVDDTLSIPDALSLQWGTGGFACYVVYSVQSLGLNTFIGKRYQNWEYLQYHGGGPNTQQGFVSGSGGPSNLFGLATLIAARAYVGGMTRDAAGNAALWLNGANDGTTVQGASVSGVGDPMAIGMRSSDLNDYLTGSIATCICYSRALSTPDRHAVEAYLSQRYSIPVSVS